MGSQVMRGRLQGGVKCAKWAKNPKNEKIGKNCQKIMKEKMKQFLTFSLKSLLLPSTQHIIAEKNEKVSWGGPQQCKNVCQDIAFLQGSWQCLDRQRGLICYITNIDSSSSALRTSISILRRDKLRFSFTCITDRLAFI